jgi:hypothetical protein
LAVVGLLAQAECEAEHKAGKRMIGGAHAHVSENGWMWDSIDLSLARTPLRPPIRPYIFMAVPTDSGSLAFNASIVKHLLRWILL